MYLRTLYKYKKWLFWLVTIVIVIQGIIFLKQGAVATPFFNYGMYSEKIPYLDNYPIYKIYANGKLLQGNDFSIQDWDRIYVPLLKFEGKDTVNAEMIDIRNRLLYKLRLGSLDRKNAHFENPDFDDQDFYSWYWQYLSYVTGVSVNDLLIVKQDYQWNGSRLLPGDSLVIWPTIP